MIDEIWEISEKLGSSKRCLLILELLLKFWFKKVHLTCFAGAIRVLASLERAGVNFALPVRQEDQALACLVQRDYSAVRVH